MKTIRFLNLSVLLALASTRLIAQNTLSDQGWPRTYSNGTSQLIVYQPQIDEWADFKTLRGRCAFALSPATGKDPVYGTLRFEGETLVDASQKVVLLRNIQATDLRFPSASDATAQNLTKLASSLLPTDALVLSLDRVLAFVRASEVPKQEARVLTNPPPIYVSTQPAILVIIDGEPTLVDVEKTNLQRVVNTNFELMQDRASKRFYLRHGDSWLTAASLSGAFTPATTLPAGLDPSAISAITRPAPPPRVIVVNQPSELVVIKGQPEISAIAGTELAVVANTDSDLFFSNTDKNYYYLASGRWFRSSNWNGPWTYATTQLPPAFSRIPSNHPKAHVLSSVPGTREAEDAVLLASIPRTAEIDRSQAKAEVHYVGSPEFVPVAGTTVSYARNTPNDVLRVGDRYYLCLNGVWFVSAAANGPWQAAEKIPTEIYSIPESSPKYHVTYVRIYNATPSTIVVGYTPGYYGAYVYGGTVVWGTGYYYHSYVAVGVAAVPVYWGAPHYTYGASAWYNPATGTYARGAAVYGPYGGYGAAAAYNPRTGTYAQGAAVWGPNGGAAAGRTYNPSTGTYSAGYHAANPYGSWGQGVVTNGSDWARGGYQSTSRGTVAAGQTSRGGAGVAVEGTNGNSGYVARSGSGDVYAGANGNVYKRDNGQWYQNQNGSWSAMDRSQVQAQQQQAAARDLGTRNAQASERWRSSGGATQARSRGLEQRPQLQGGRRR